MAELRDTDRTPLTEPPRHPATAAVWEWLEHGDGLEKSGPIRVAARERVEELDRLFIEWDAERESRPINE